MKTLLEKFKSNKVNQILCIVLAITMLLSCTMAYFTDRATTQATGTAGTVAISLNSGIDLTDAKGMDILNPGDRRSAEFSVHNEGNKSIDVRTTIVLTAQSVHYPDLVFTGSSTTQSEFDLYLRDDVELLEGRGYAPKAGKQPLQVKSIDKDTITYIVPQYSLNGNSERYDEVETIDGVEGFAHTYDYVLVFKGEAGNEWQDVSIQLDVLVEAKQHENTGAGWDIVAKEDFVSGNINQEAVKGENVITDDNGKKGNGAITFSFIDSDTDEGIEDVKLTLIKLDKQASFSMVGNGENNFSVKGERIAVAKSDSNGSGMFSKLEPGTYALIASNFVLTDEANSLVVEENGVTHYEFYGSMTEMNYAHKHVEVEVGNYIYVYCTDVKSSYRNEENTHIYYPYSYYYDPYEEIEEDFTHKHVEVEVGNYIYVFCSDVADTYRSNDGKKIFYPYHCYFEGE